MRDAETEHSNVLELLSRLPKKNKLFFSKFASAKAQHP